MAWVAIVLIGITSNLDNLGAGMAIGLRTGPVALGPNTVIAAITMIATAVAMEAGGGIGRSVPASVASLLGGLVICAMGAWVVVVALRSPRRPDDAGVRHHGGRVRRSGSGSASPRPMAAREAMVLGVSLSLDNIGTGVGGGAARLPVATTTLITGSLSLLAVGLGSRIGHSAGVRMSGRPASLAGGCLLVVVGVGLTIGR